MRIILRSPLYIRILLWITIAVSIVGLTIGILVFAGVHLEVTSGQATLLVSVFSLTLVFSVLLSTIHYKIDAHYIHLNIAFLDMLSNRIQIEKILEIVLYDKKLYISYLWKGRDPVIALISISPKRFDDFKNYLISKNKNIVYYDNDNKTESSDSEQQ